ncbi:MAG: alpha/beta hydrolase [Candidatus Pelagibacterales bacterium]|nr:MAG: alpha/beta hydrolase [Pelagibacterales bacterium]
MNYFTTILLIFLLIYFFILVSTYFFQRNLLYHPSENNYFGDKLNVPITEVKITTQDNIELLAWYHNKDAYNYKTILFFHGNAGSLENRIHKINHFKDMNVNFLIIAWRGFSGNKGKPTEEGLYDDARSAITWLKKQGIKENNIIIYGESLGTGVATEVAQKKNFAGIILESPFTSMVEAGKDKYPFLPVRLLLKDKYESDKKIKNINSPILIMHGKVDNIVPFHMGKKMYELANEPKYSYFSEYDDHMMEYNKTLLKALKNFISSLN